MNFGAANGHGREEELIDKEFVCVLYFEKKETYIADKKRNGDDDMAYKVAICDDVQTDAEYVAELLTDWAKERGYMVPTKWFPSAESFLFHYAENKAYNILLLDIEMGETDGVDLAKKVRWEDENLQIVFITGYPDYIGEGYEVAALHYLMKPVDREKLFMVLDRAVTNLQKRKRAVVLPIDGEAVKVPMEEIQYVEAFSHSVSVVTTKGIYELRKSLSEMETLLGEGFVRCHRSYLVGLHFVAGLSKTKVTLDNGTELPLSRSAATMVHKAFIAYYTGDENETV